MSQDMAKVPVVVQPDNEGRLIQLVSVHDGDTIKVNMMVQKLGEVEMWLHNVRLRLRGVSAYEIDKGTPDDIKVATMEREALNALLTANTSLPLTARLFRQTHDRYEVEIRTADGKNVNEIMRTYSQGGR